jgi:hypothetical protein
MKPPRIAYQIGVPDCAEIPGHSPFLGLRSRRALRWLGRIQTTEELIREGRYQVLRARGQVMAEMRQSK